MVPTVRPALHPLQAVIAGAVNLDTKPEKETLINPDVKLKSVAFEIDILKLAPTVTITPTAKQSMVYTGKADINMVNTDNRLNLSEKTDTTGL